ncbi:MAG: FtsX-like permease family protein, partial [Clostridia bacterium]|nr:FtsX-like permease family protein [Clostridia bacterium]
VELQKAEERYDEGILALRDARQVLAARRTAVYQQLAEQEEELARNQAELTAALEQLAAGKPALDKAAADIAAMEKQLAALLAVGQTEQAVALQAALDAAKPAYEEQLALFTAGETELLGAQTRLEEGAAAIEEARLTAEGEFAAIEAQLTATDTALADAAAEIAAGKKALAAGERELKEKEAELKKGKEDLAAGEEEFATAKAEAEEQLAEGQAKLDEAAADIAAIPFPTWYVLDRQSIAAFSGFDGNCQKVEAIATVFPIFFFLVAALVALTTMTRMVEEQRVAIGVLRALGYGKVAVAGKFLLYAGLASLGGGAVGLAVGMKVFPAVIYYVYGIMYHQPPLLAPFRWDYALVIGTLALLCTGLATLFACMGTLRERPARLMMPKAPKAGKRVFLEYLPLWKRMSFLQKVTARNLFRYKKRFFMTVLGVMGCTALLLAGFGLHDSIFGIGDKQYGELSSYDMMVVMKTEEALQDADILALRQDERLTGSLGVYQQSVEVKKEKERLSVHLFVPEEADVLPDFITLRERERGKAVPLTNDGAVLTEKAAATLGVSVGDTVEVIRTDGTAATVTVGGVAENYVNSYLYLTPAAYEKAFGEVPPCQILLLQEREADSGIAADLLATEQVASLSVTADMRASISDMLGSLDAIVVVIILCAGLLAFVVLYNLTNINITERQRELATLKVLGFYDSESAAYIYRENAVLTLIGIAVGLVAGIFLHQFVIRTAEVEMVMFQRTVQPLSYLWAALLTLVFAALVDLVMLRRLRRIDMVESMKSSE